MDYSDYSQQHSQPSPQRAWPPQLLTPAPPQSQSTPQSQSQQQQPFPSPVSPGPYYFPSQNHTPQQQPGGQQTSPTNDSRPTSSALSLNLSALSVASPTTLSPIGPHQAQSVPFHPHQLQSHHPIPHHPHHTHSHSHSSSSVLSVSPITPVSPPSFSPSHLSQPTFSFNFEDGLSTNAGGGGLSPTPDSLLAQRRPSTGSHSTSSSELVVEKSVPRKRSLTNTLPVSQPLALGHSMHHHSHSHSYTPTQPRQGGAHHTLPHPIITTTASSPPPPTSPTSPSSSHPSHSHSHSLSHSHSHSSLSHSSLSQAHSSQHPHPTQIDINAHPASPYEETDSAGARYTIIGDEGSEDEFGSASFGGGGSANAKPSGSSGQGGGQGVIGKPMGTNNFVTKLYQMINDSKSQLFIAWTDLGTSFVVSNVGEFSRSILGAHFKHNNFSSFVRQLNMYGFHKINRTPRAQRTSTTSQTWEFSHPKFLRARPDLLDAIKRKALEPDPRERGRVELPGEVARLLSELREENRALWREVSRLGGRVPAHVSSAANNPSNCGPASAPASFGGTSLPPQSQTSSQSPQSQSQAGLARGHVLSHSRSSSNLGDDGERDGEWEDEDGNADPMSGVGMGIGGGAGGGSQGVDEWDSQGSRLAFGGGLSVPGTNSQFSFNNSLGAGPGVGEEWKRWVEAEMSNERKRLERLVGVVRAFVDVVGNGGEVLGSGGAGDGAGEGGIPQNILQDLQALSLSFNASPSPLSLSVQSPSPSPSPLPFSHPQHSPNIYITSPTSPSPFTISHAHSPTRHSPNHVHAHSSHSNLPTLSIPNSANAATSHYAHSLHTPSSSPTAADFPAPFFGQGQGHGHSRSLSSLSSHSHPGHGHLSKQPSITLTVDPGDDGRGEAKRQRTEGGDNAEGALKGSLGSMGGEHEDMDIIPNDADEEVKLPTSMLMPTGALVAAGAGGGGPSRVAGMRARSDSAPMWGPGMGGEAGGTGGLSANWGRGRSGSSYTRGNQS